jgi:hypothetical protein
MDSNKQIAKSLLQSANISYERLKETNIEKYPTNTLVDYYDIIHKLLEANALINNQKIKGEGAHQKLIDYVAKKQIIDEKTRIFLQDLRDYRNKISYEGYNIKLEFIKQNLEELENIIKKLKKIFV